MVSDLGPCDIFNVTHLGFDRLGLNVKFNANANGITMGKMSKINHHDLTNSIELHFDETQQGKGRFIIAFFLPPSSFLPPL